MQTFVRFPLLFFLVAVETKETRTEKREKEGREGREGEVRYKKEQKRRTKERKRNRKHVSVQSIYLCLFPLFFNSSVFRGQEVLGGRASGVGEGQQSV